MISAVLPLSPLLLLGQLQLIYFKPVAKVTYRGRWGICNYVVFKDLWNSYLLELDLPEILKTTN